MRVHVVASLSISLVLLVPVAQAAPKTAPAKSAPPVATAAPAAPAPPPAAEAAAPVPPAEPPPAPPRKVDPNDGRRSVAIMEVASAPPVTADAATAFADALSQELDDLGVFRTITRSDVLQMLKFAQLQQLSGCDEAACFNALGSAVGAEYLVNGSVRSVGSKLLLQFRLVHVATSRVIQRVSRSYDGGLDDVLADLPDVARTLMRDELQAHSGSLKLECTEEGATVRIDGSIVGVTPLAALSVAGGVHVVAVEKASFVRGVAEVRVVEGRTSEVKVVLVPSDDFRKQYIEQATKGRLIAWSFVGAGVAVIAAGGGLVGYSLAESADLRADVVAFNDDPASRTSEAEAELNGRRSRLGLVDGAALASIGVGFVATAVGAVLVATGDDPSRFDALPAAAAVSVVPFPGGLALKGSF